MDIHDRCMYKKFHHYHYLQGIIIIVFLLTTCPKKFMFLAPKTHLLRLSLKFTSLSLANIRFKCFRCLDQEILCTFRLSTKTLKNCCIHFLKMSIIVWVKVFVVLFKPNGINIQLKSPYFMMIAIFLISPCTIQIYQKPFYMSNA
jgi:hypothetical protein